MEASCPYHHKFTQAASRPASNDRQIYNHPYTLLPENIYPVQLDSATQIFFFKHFPKMFSFQTLSMYQHEDCKTLGEMQPCK